MSVFRSKIASSKFRPLRRSTAFQVASLRLAAALVVFAGLDTSARSEEFSATYRVTFAGLPVGEGRVSGQLNDGGYSARVDGSVGVLGLLNVFVAESQGSLQQMRMRPTSYRISTTGPEGRKVVVAFKDGRAVRTTMTPDYTETDRAERLPILPVHQEGVVDPMTALLTQALRAAGGDPCQGTSHVFSGQSRFDVVFGRGEASDGEIVCHVMPRLIAGHKRASAQVPPRTILVAYPAQTAGNGPRFPVRIELPTALGTFIVRRAT